MATLVDQKTSSAIEKAKEKIALLTNNKHKDVRIEQLEFSNDDLVLSCVISYLILRDKLNDDIHPAMFTMPKYERIYKEIKFEKDGSILGVYFFKPYL